jgi:hypothetical protein
VTETAALNVHFRLVSRIVISGTIHSLYLEQGKKVDTEGSSKVTAPNKLHGFLSQKKIIFKVRYDSTKFKQTTMVAN